MNDNQRMVLIAVVVIVLLMLLFPPFQYRLPNGAIRNLGYSFILSPPPIEKFISPFELNPIVGSVNITMLVIQWIGIIIAGAIAFFMLKDR